MYEKKETESRRQYKENKVPKEENKNKQNRTEIAELATDMRKRENKLFEITKEE